MTDNRPIDRATDPIARKFYFAAWRWHFYAGLFVIPFLVMLALTGAFMMIYSGVSNELGMVADVSIKGDPLPVSAQAKTALQSVPGGSLATYIAPEAANRPAFFEISKSDAYFSVAVDPYSGAILNVQDQASTYRAMAEKLHGTLMLGVVGDRLVETSASLAMVLIATGLYMWWPRQKGVLQSLVPNLAQRGRQFWKELHVTVGAWISLFLALFLLSGLAWSGIWGDKFVQPWGSFPASKWDNVPLSDVTHASLNHDIFHNVPWSLEQTPMPASGSLAGTPAVKGPVVLDTVAQWAAANGFVGQYKLAVPSSDTGVFTVSYDGRNEDSASPSQDRFVHIDRYTGNILADVRFSDYPILGKAMAWGIALHKGLAGTWNFVFNLAYLALVLFMCVSGTVMWWKRRPTEAGRLVAPPVPDNLPLWKGAVLVALITSLAFPMAGLTLIIVLAFDVLVLANIPALRRALS